MAEIAQRIGSGSARVSTRLPRGTPTTAASQEQADAAPVDQPHDTRAAPAGRPRSPASGRARTPTAGPYSAENTGVMIMAAPKPAKPRTMPAMQATAAQIRKGKASRSGMKHGDASIAGPQPAHHIMQAMPSKNLAVSTVPLLMPYIQRRPETVGGKPFKLVSDYKPAGDQPEAIRQLIEGVQGGERDQVLLGVTGSGKTFTMANVIATHPPAGAGAGAQQDPGRPALERDEDVLPEERGRVLRLLLRLLPARSLCAAHRHLSSRRIRRSTSRSTACATRRRAL